MNITLGLRESPAESLIIGVRHPNGQSYYAMMKGHDEIFLVGSLYPKVINMRLRKLMKGTKPFPETPILGPLRPAPDKPEE